MPSWYACKRREKTACCFHPKHQLSMHQCLFIFVSRTYHYLGIVSKANDTCVPCRGGSTLGPSGQCVCPITSVYIEIEEYESVPAAIRTNSSVWQAFKLIRGGQCVNCPLNAECPPGSTLSTIRPVAGYIAAPNSYNAAFVACGVSEACHWNVTPVSGEFGNAKRDCALDAYTGSDFRVCGVRACVCVCRYVCACLYMVAIIMVLGIIILSHCRCNMFNLCLRIWQIGCGWRWR